MGPRIRLQSHIVATILALLASHASAAQTVIHTTVDPQHKSLLAADSALAAQIATRGPAAIFVSLPPGAPVLIPDAPILRDAATARALFQRRYPDGTRLELRAQHAVLSADGQLGCTVGLTKLRLPDDAPGKSRPGRYATCWKRQSDGSWRPAAHSRNGEIIADAALGTTLDRAATDPASDPKTNPADALRTAQDADAAFAKFASDSGPALAFNRWAAADAMLLGALPKPRRGPEDIAAAFASFPPSGKFSWAPVRSLGAAGGGLAFTVGEAVITTNGKRANTKYLTIWRQESDGRWMYIFDLGSDRP
jgi:ketosteroid isomerase-like protein